MSPGVLDWKPQRFSFRHPKSTARLPRNFANRPESEVA
ncbi:hypothetical protein AGRO_0738 [Agrobacterium sp. ATCC 31749]|nr:hypothetical protein AGRO_0738 [Agrobacterium sp. ATCC 31749]